MDVVWLMAMVSFVHVHQDILVQDVKYAIHAHQIRKTKKKLLKRKFSSLII